MIDQMPSVADRILHVREALVSYRGVVTRRMFGTEAYFVGPAMFAFLTSTSVVLRLPHSAFADAVTDGRAKPFLSLGAAQLNGWAEVPLASRPLEQVEPLLAAAHTSGTHAARVAARRRRPQRARRVRTS